MAGKKGQIIFMNGKEKALKSLFVGEACPFGYLAVGYVENDNGFEDIEGQYGFNELEEGNGYQRVQLKLHGENPVETDPDTGKVLVKVEATLTENIITTPQMINQIAIVDNGDLSADTVLYSATTFESFSKSAESSITFVIGFRL